MFQRQDTKILRNEAYFATLISKVERDGNIPILFRKVVLKLSRGNAQIPRNEAYFFRTLQ